MVFCYFFRLNFAGFKKDLTVDPNLAISLSRDILSTDNERLTCELTDEIYKVIYQISPLIALGPDTIHATFYHKCGISLLKIYVA